MRRGGSTGARVLPEARWNAVACGRSIMYHSPAGSTTCMQVVGVQDGLALPVGTAVAHHTGLRRCLSSPQG